jgi:hypothetical protein
MCVYGCICISIYTYAFHGIYFIHMSYYYVINSQFIYLFPLYLYFYYSAKAKNREHAKNTRIRKKHYIEALKESLKLLLEKRDKTDKDQRITLSRLAEQVSDIYMHICVHTLITVLRLFFITKEVIR